MMPINLPKTRMGGQGGGGDRRVLQEIHALYTEVKEQTERLRRVEQQLNRVDQSIQQILTIVEGLSRS